MEELAAEVSTWKLVLNCSAMYVALLERLVLVLKVDLSVVVSAGTGVSVGTDVSVATGASIRTGVCAGSGVYVTLDWTLPDFFGSGV